MKTDDRARLETWCAAGRDLVDFEIVPVRTSAELEIGHGHSSATLRSVLRELKPYVGVIRELD